MYLLRNMSVIVILAGQLMPALAQKHSQPEAAAIVQPSPKTPAGVNSLFADLPIDDAAGNSVLNNGESGPEKIKKNIFVIGSLNKSVCYAGEPLLLTYQLYSALQSKSLVAERPALSNFNVEERPLNNEMPAIKKKGDKDYRVFTIWQVQLNPFQPGSLVIDPLLVNNEVNYTSDNKTYAYSGSVSSNRPVLTVLPLPEYRGPEKFSGAIGRFQLKAFVGSHRIAADETDSLHLEIEGSGNLNDITTPAIKWPAGFEYFPAKEKWELRKNSFPPTGKKVVTIPFVAHKEGHFTIPSIGFTYFDPSLKTYQELHSDPVVVDILPALSSGGSALSSDKRPPAVSPPVQSHHPSPYTWIIWSLPAALAIFAITIGWIRNRSRPSEAKTAVASMPSAIPIADPASGEPAAAISAQDKDALLVANAKRELESLVTAFGKERNMPGKEQHLSAQEKSFAGQEQSLSDKEQRPPDQGQLSSDKEQHSSDQGQPFSGKGLTPSDQGQPLSDKEQYIVSVKDILSRFLQEKFQTDEISGDELADTVYRRTRDHALAEQVREVYACCSRLLYSPSDLTAADASLAGATSSIIERCETIKI